MLWVFHNTLTDVISSCKKRKVFQTRIDKQRFFQALGCQINYLKKKKALSYVQERPYDLNFKTYCTKFCDNLQKKIDLTENQYYADKIKNCNGDFSTM